jgi:Outer membrane protein beta-barrel domain
MRPLYLLFLFSVLPVMAQTQPFTFGVKGGVPAQTPLGQTDNRMPIALGPTVNVRIFSRLSIETGVLFHRMGQYVGTGAVQYPEDALTLVSTTQRARALEVPVLAKFHLRAEHQTWRPFVTLGPSIRRTSVDSGYLSTILSGTHLSTFAPQPGLNMKRVNWSVDPSIGAGLDLRTGRFHLEPEVRYSYWGAGVNLPVRKNQAGFLLGFRF